MELSVKNSVLLMLVLLSTSFCFLGFSTWKNITKKSLDEATAYYNDEKVTIHQNLTQIQFPVLRVKNQNIDRNTAFDERSIASAQDVQDGDISKQIVIYGSVNTQVAGKYSLRYVVRNSYGLKSVKNITVSVS